MEHLRLEDRIPEGKPAHEDRLVLLCDGVFAIAITLLVLDVRIIGENFSDGLKILLVRIILYCGTFVSIASYWMFHRRIMHYVKRIDTRFIQLTLLFLLFVALFPAAMGVLGDNGEHPEVVIFYVVVTAACGYSSMLLWLYATWKHRLVDADLDQDLINFTTTRLFVIPSFCMLSLLLLFFPPIQEHPYSVFAFWPLLAVVIRAARLIYGHRLKGRERHVALAQDAEHKRSALAAPQDEAVVTKEP